jgi:hypothetical protein
VLGGAGGGQQRLLGQLRQSGADDGTGAVLVVEARGDGRGQGERLRLQRRVGVAHHGGAQPAVLLDHRDPGERRQSRDDDVGEPGADLVRLEAGRELHRRVGQHQPHPGGLLGLEPGGALALQRLQPLDRRAGHLGELYEDRLVRG